MSMFDSQSPKQETTLDNWDLFNDAFSHTLANPATDESHVASLLKTSNEGTVFSPLESFTDNRLQKDELSGQSYKDLSTASSLYSNSPSISFDVMSTESQDTLDDLDLGLEDFERKPSNARYSTLGLFADVLSPVHEQVDLEHFHSFQPPPPTDESLLKSPDLFKMPPSTYDNVQHRLRSVSTPGTPTAALLRAQTPKKTQSPNLIAKKSNFRLGHSNSLKLNKTATRLRSTSNPASFVGSSSSMMLTDFKSGNNHCSAPENKALQSKLQINSSQSPQQANVFSTSPSAVMDLLGQMQLQQPSLESQFLSHTSGDTQNWKQAQLELLAAAKALQNAQPGTPRGPLRNRGYSDPLQALTSLNLRQTQPPHPASLMQQAQPRTNMVYPTQKNFSYPSVSVTIAELRMKLDEELLSVDYEDITVNELKDHLRRRNLACKGKKQSLLHKLLLEKKKAGHRMRQRAQGMSEEELIAREAKEAASSTVLLTQQQARRLSCSSAGDSSFYTNYDQSEGTFSDILGSTNLNNQNPTFNNPSGTNLTQMDCNIPTITTTTSGLSEILKQTPVIDSGFSSTPSIEDANENQCTNTADELFNQTFMNPPKGGVPFDFKSDEMSFFEI